MPNYAATLTRRVQSAARVVTGHCIIFNDAAVSSACQVPTGASRNHDKLMTTESQNGNDYSSWIRARNNVHLPQYIISFDQYWFFKQTWAAFLLFNITSSDQNSAQLNSTLL